MNRKKCNTKGFTLAELLIVVAIIAVLVAVAIPVFTAQLKKSKQATDLANARSVYAMLSADFLANGISTVNVTMTQNGNDCSHVTAENGFAAEADGVNGPITVTVTDANGNSTETFYFSGASYYLQVDVDYTGKAPYVLINDEDDDTWERFGNEDIEF